MSRTPAIALCLLALLVSTPGMASMRCGSGLINEGQSMQEVLDTCGPPVGRQVSPAARKPNGYLQPGAVDVARWVYGPTNGMFRILRFIDGRLVQIESQRERGP